jgi:hypothetical protein
MAPERLNQGKLVSMAPFASNARADTKARKGEKGKGYERKERDLNGGVLRVKTRIKECSSAAARRFAERSNSSWHRASALHLSRRNGGKWQRQTPRVTDAGTSTNGKTLVK